MGSDVISAEQATRKGEGKDRRTAGLHAIGSRMHMHACITPMRAG